MIKYIIQQLDANGDVYREFSQHSTTETKKEIEHKVAMQFNMDHTRIVWLP